MCAPLSRFPAPELQPVAVLVVSKPLLRLRCTICNWKISRLAAVQVYLGRKTGPRPPIPAATPLQQVRRRSSAAAPLPQLFSQLINHVETACLPAQLPQVRPATATSASSGGGGGGAGQARRVLAVWPSGWPSRLAAGRLGGRGAGLGAPSGDSRAGGSQIVAAAGHLTVGGCRRYGR